MGAMLEVTPVRAFSDNYIWIIHGARQHARVAAVDPGEAGPVISALEQQHWQLSAILVTHHHPDHVGGVSELV
jgi:hydroxyacylglutathione hydrolase